MNATSAQISGMFRWCGPKPLSVRPTSPRNGSGGGYVAVFGSRADALEAGRLVLSAFEADPEAGTPSLAVFVKRDGSALLCVGIDR